MLMLKDFECSESTGAAAGHLSESPIKYVFGLKLVWQVHLPSTILILFVSLSLHLLCSSEIRLSHTHTQPKHTVITSPGAYISPASPLIWSLDFLGCFCVLSCLGLLLSSIIYHRVSRDPEGKRRRGKTSLMFCLLWYTSSLSMQGGSVLSDNVRFNWSVSVSLIALATFLTVHFCTLDNMEINNHHISAIIFGQGSLMVQSIIFIAYRILTTFQTTMWKQCDNVKAVTEQKSTTWIWNSPPLWVSVHSSVSFTILVHAQCCWSVVCRNLRHLFQAKVLW